jgi:hypothetical protein
MVEKIRFFSKTDCVIFLFIPDYCAFKLSLFDYFETDVVMMEILLEDFGSSDWF